MILIGAAPVSGQSPETPVILSPRTGEAIQGGISITGTVETPGFVSYEVAYAYQGNEANWFLIQESQQVVKEGTLAVWDTSAITDGNYALRVRVFLQDGSMSESTVTGLRVRNYTTIETNTPEPTEVISTQSFIPTVTHTPMPTPTNLPPNPIKLTERDLFQSMKWGGAAAGLFLMALGLYYLFTKFHH